MMKSCACLIPLLAALAAAYPSVSNIVVDGNAAINARQQDGEPTPGFNAAAQLVDVTGEHEFQAPNFAAGDTRGPCPGLNAMANHAYLPRNGVGSHIDFISGTFEVFGMSADLSGFLTVLGAVLDGDGLQWSIGGPQKTLPGLPPLLGVPQGISGSHNRYESDVSPGRGDLYEYGNDYSLQLNQFQQLYDMGMANGDNFSLNVLNEFRSQRFDQSVANNPYFFNGPFTGVLVQPAAYTFIYRFMGNKSAEYPDGYLNSEVLMSFFGVSKDSDGSLTLNPGMEQIPYNWYKRAIGDEYSIPLLQIDTVAAATQYPKFLTIGGNTGEVNTLTGITPGDIMTGVTNTQSLLQGDNLFCFAMEFIVQAAPDLIRCSAVISDVESAISTLNSQLASSLSQLTCPKLGAPDVDQFSQFPGYSKLNCQSGDYGPAV